MELEGLESECFFGKAKQELARIFQTTANWLDNTFSFGSKTKVEATTTTNGNSKNTVSVESTTSVSTNSGPFMSYVIHNNTNKGYTGSVFKTTTETTVNVGAKLDVKTPLGSGSLSTSIDQSGKQQSQELVHLKQRPV